MYIFFSFSNCLSVAQSLRVMYKCNIWRRKNGMEPIYNHFVVMIPWSSNHTRMIKYPFISWKGSKIESLCVWVCAYTCVHACVYGLFSIRMCRVTDTLLLTEQKQWTLSGCIHSWLSPGTANVQENIWYVMKNEINLNRSDTPQLLELSQSTLTAGNIISSSAF